MKHFLFIISILSIFSSNAFAEPKEGICIIDFFNEGRSFIPQHIPSDNIGENKTEIDLIHSRVEQLANVLRAKGYIPNVHYGSLFFRGIDRQLDSGADLGYRLKVNLQTKTRGQFKTKFKMKIVLTYKPSLDLFLKPKKILTVVKTTTKDYFDKSNNENGAFEMLINYINNEMPACPYKD